MPLTDREPAFVPGVFIALVLSSVKLWQWFSNEEIRTLMRLDDSLKVTFDEVWIQIQVCLAPNMRQHRHDENRKQKLLRYFRTGTSKHG